MSERFVVRTRTSPFPGLILALLVVLSQGILRLTTVPLWAHYDEPTHYEYMRYLVEHGKIPTGQQPDFAILERIAATFPEAIIANCYQIDTEGTPCVPIGHQFDEAPGYYLIQALFQRLLHPARINGQVWLARIVSVLLAVGVGWLGYATARDLFPEEPLLAAGVPLLLGLIGSYSDLMSALNNDVGAVAGVSLFVYAMVRSLKRGLSPSNGLLLAVSLIAAWLTKSSARIALPLAAIGLLLTFWPSLPLWGKVASGVVGTVGLVWALHWEPGVGPLLRPAIDQVFPFGGINQRLPFWYDQQNWSYYGHALRWQFVTFWSAFGYGVPGLPRGPLVVLSGLSGIAAVGVFKGWKQMRLSGWQARSLLFLAIVVSAALFMSFLRIDNPAPNSYVPTARHFFVAIIPVVIFLLVGWKAWLPARTWKYGMAGIVLGLYGLDVWSILTVQIPWFAANWPIGFH